MDLALFVGPRVQILLSVDNARLSSVPVCVLTHSCAHLASSEVFREIGNTDGKTSLSGDLCPSAAIIQVGKADDGPLQPTSFLPVDREGPFCSKTQISSFLLASVTLAEATPTQIYRQQTAKEPSPAPLLGHWCKQGPGPCHFCLSRNVCVRQVRSWQQTSGPFWQQRRRGSRGHN